MNNESPEETVTTTITDWGCIVMILTRPAGGVTRRFLNVADNILMQDVEVSASAGIIISIRLLGKGKRSVELREPNQSTQGLIVNRPASTDLSGDEGMIWATQLETENLYAGFSPSPLVSRDVTFS